MNLPAPEKQETQKVDREFDSWYDRGHWLVILLLPVVLYCFRRGVLLSLLLIPLAGLSPTKSYALGWDDLWKNKNQQAYDQLQQEQATEAAQNFEDPEWKASAQYRAGDYAEAAKNFSQFDTANAHYNRGNALAKAGKLPEAIKAFDEALKQQPDLEDAKNNRQLVEDAIKQQQQKQDQQNQDQKQDKNSDQQNKQDQQQDQKDQQDQSQQNQDKQQNQDSQNQKNSDQNDQQQSEQDQSQQDQQKEQQKQDMKNQAQKDQQQEQQNNEQPSDKQQQNANQPKDEQQKDDEKKQAAQPAEEDKEQPAEQQDAQAATPADDGLTDEERQAMEQWLRRVPDDPGGLLRNKFNYEHYKRNQEMLNGEWSAPENGAEGRW